jgi:hypothetical protein
MENHVSIICVIYAIRLFSYQEGYMALCAISHYNSTFQNKRELAIGSIAAYCLA